MIFVQTVVSLHFQHGVYLLEIRDLRVSYAGRGEVLRGLQLNIHSGETVALTGPSGSGKSTLAYSILQLLPADCVQSGSIRFEGIQLMGQKPAVLRQLRGKAIAAIPQQPAVALHPLVPVGRQIEDVLRSHRLHTPQSRATVLDLFARLGLSEDCFQRYPHQLSGGQLQRAAIAQALICGPKLLIADEPFAALDAVARAEVAELIRTVLQSFPVSLLLISHDLRAVSTLAGRVMVLRGGEVEEVE